MPVFDYHHLSRNYLELLLKMQAYFIYGKSAEVFELIDQARKLGCRKIILETTADWSEVVAFYESAGFTRTEIRDGDQYFEMILTE